MAFDWIFRHAGRRGSSTNAPLGGLLARVARLFGRLRRQAFAGARSLSDAFRLGFFGAAENGASGKAIFHGGFPEHHPVPTLILSMPVSALHAKPLKDIRNSDPRGIANKKPPVKMPDSSEFARSG